ncbi:hypothetical protein ABXS73_10075 [Intestinimonas butyriciproducens]
MGKRIEKELQEKESLIQECLGGADADAGGGAKSWGRSFHDAQLDQPVPG